VKECEASEAKEDELQKRLICEWWMGQNDGGEGKDVIR
jgi:hypothetical protein